MLRSVDIIVESLQTTLYNMEETFDEANVVEGHEKSST
jgi:hypothetical protein